jgi:hypothetical protein
MNRLGYALTGSWLVAGVLYFVATYVPVTADSYAYVAAALSFVEQGQFTLPFAEASATSLPVPYSAWPPAFPALIGLFHLVVPDAWLAARIITALSVACAVLIICRTLSVTRGGWPAVAFSTCSCMTLVVAFTAWSEGPFLLALVALWSGLARWLESEGASSSALYLALAGLTLAPLFRYAGLFCVPVAVWFLARWARPRQRRQVTFSTILALLPVSVWLLRNTVLGLSARGGTPAPPSWWRAFAELPHGLGGVAFFPAVDIPWAQIAGGMVVLAAAGIAMRRTRVTTGSETSVVALWLGFSLLAGTVVSRFVGMAGPLTDRLVWPGFFLLLLGLILALTHSLSRRSTWALLIAYILIQGGGVLRYPGARPRAEMTMDHFQVPSQPTGQQAFVSNAPWRVWAATGRSGYYLPRLHLHGHVLSPDTLSHWAASRGVHYLLWLAEEMSPEQAYVQFGPLAALSRGSDTLGLRLVRSDSLYHTYQIPGVR